MTILPTIAAGLGIAGAVLNASAPHAPTLGLAKDAAVAASQWVWAWGNALWLAYGLRTGQRPLAVQFGVFLAISGWGVWSWS
ncbi:MAG: hypothetical protein ACOZHQ_09255 [Thermodesulfobacteriota bacterium]